MELLLFVVDTTRLLVAAPLFLNKQSVVSQPREAVKALWVIVTPIVSFLSSTAGQVVEAAGV